MNPNAFTYISWSNLLKKYVGMQSEASILRRLKALEETEATSSEHEESK